MPYKDESKLMATGGDAPNDTSTQLCFDPPEGPFGDENVVMGSIDPENPNDEDWIVIKLTEGHMYTIAVGGGDADGELNDSVLKLLDAKGNVIEMNDDKDAMKGNLSSEIKGFMPEAGTGTQVYYISVSGYTGNPGANNTGAYTVRVSEVAVLPVGAGGDIVAGSDASHKLTGTSNAEKIVGKGGDDTLDGMGGDDELNGGGGNDLLIGGKGADKLTGGDAEDAEGERGIDTISYRGSAMGVTINLSDGAARGGDADGDTIGDDIENVMGSMHDDMLTGNRRDNELWGLDGNDELDGGRRNDKLYGGAGDDMLDGGAGNDELEGGYGADVLTGGDGEDWASYASSMMGVTVRLHSSQAMGGDAEGDTWGGSVTETYANEDGDDVEVTLADIAHLIGSANDDILAGDIRDNMIKGGAGNDRIYGGPNPADAHKTNSGLDNADTLMGGDGDDHLFGGAGNDILHGDAGNDHLWGNGGTNEYYGGAGSDTIYANGTDTVIFGGAAMDNPDTDVDESMEMEGDVDTVSFEKLKDEGIGEDASNRWTLGEDATDIENVIGTQSDDYIAGDANNNVIEGGEGGDDMDGGQGEDTVSYESSDDWVRVSLGGVGTTTSASRGHASGDTLTNFANIRGSAHDDDLTGNNAANKLWGLGGDDEIVGGDDDDTIEGGAGADEMDGDNGGLDTQTRGMADVLSYAMSDSGVTVNLATAMTSGGHAEGDTIVTYEVEVQDEDGETIDVDVSTFEYVTGSMHDDNLTGDNRDNRLEGGAGDDTLRGGASDAGDRSTNAAIRGDILIGGPGADMLDGGEDKDEKNDMVPDTSEDAAEGAMLRASIDWAVYKYAKEGVTVNMATGKGTGGEAMGDTLMNIELIWGSEYNDTFISGPGSNIFEGDGGSDTVSYEESEMGVWVDLSNDEQHATVAATGSGTEASPYVFPLDGDPAAAGTAYSLNGVPELNAKGEDFDDVDNIKHEDDNPNANGAAGDRLRSIENLTGSNQKDELTGDENPNVLKGMGGDDELIGNAGNDKLYGGDGDDTLISGEGSNMLMGGAGDDKLTGGDGADTLTGGAGDDDLTGGSGGNDKFVFAPGDTAGDSDAILDWEAGDLIDLSAFDLTAEQLKAAISLRGTGTDAFVVINLEAHGGGRITIEDISDLDTFDKVTTENNLIDMLNEHKDANNDGDFSGSYDHDGDPNTAEVSEAGIFIL